jgi:hypothetical protein
MPVGHLCVGGDVDPRMNSAVLNDHAVAHVDGHVLHPGIRRDMHVVEDQVEL